MKQSRATLFGLPNSPEAYELRDFLKRSGSPFEWIDLKTDDDARRLAGVTGLDDPRLPVCVMEKGSVLFRPTIRDLAAALDWFRGPKHERYDLAIYGAGPAGLSAAVYGASEGLRTIVLERSAVGGQAGSTSRIDNYLGFPDGISGWELASRARQQAQRLGAEIIVTAEGVGGETRDGWTVSWLSEGQEIVARQSAPLASNMLGSALLTRRSIWGVGCFTEPVQVKPAAVQVESSSLAAETRRDKRP
jgi:thioredoxin reductase (NADPH)